MQWKHSLKTLRSLLCLQAKETLQINQIKTLSENILPLDKGFIFRNPSIGLCGCAVCESCSYNGVERRNRESFASPQDEHCSECYCQVLSLIARVRYLFFVLYCFLKTAFIFFAIYSRILYC